MLMFTFGLSGRIVAADTGQSQYYELRVYTTQSEEQQDRISAYWEKAAVPAYNRLGIAPVGVFTELEASPTNHIYVLIPFPNAAAYAAGPVQLAADADYQAAGAGYLNAPKTDPAYERFESSLLVAFDGMKSLALPPSSAERKPLIFELRTYQSHSENKGINKVRMFNSGEIPLMQDVGLSPVFFGQMVVGSQMPNLTYMLSGENMAAHKEHWKAFGDSPIWKKLSGDPLYKDNVSKIISIFLKRTPASQI